VHADGYRLKSEAELEATGLLETLWDPEAVVLFEWMDLFPETADALARSELPCLTVRLAIVRGDGGTERRIEFERTGF
jgi:tRNA A37 threonylcarbamoyladenosine biosynthesis protein TsaE